MANRSALGHSRTTVGQQLDACFQLQFLNKNMKSKFFFMLEFFKFIRQLVLFFYERWSTRICLADYVLIENSSLLPNC